MAWYIRVTSRAATSYEDLSSHYFIIKHIIRNLLLTDVTGFIKPYTASLRHTKRLFIFKKEWYKYLTVNTHVDSQGMMIHPKCGQTSVSSLYCIANLFINEFLRLKISAVHCYQGSMDKDICHSYITAYMSLEMHRRGLIFRTYYVPRCNI